MGGAGFQEPELISKAEQLWLVKLSLFPLPMSDVAFVAAVAAAVAVATGRGGGQE